MAAQFTSWTKPDVSVSGDMIRLTIRTSIADGAQSAQCPENDLGLIRDGTDLVVYRDPDGHEQPIGQSKRAT
jgi:hypothetical protein